MVIHWNCTIQKNLTDPYNTVVFVISVSRWNTKDDTFKFYHNFLEKEVG